MSLAVVLVVHRVEVIPQGLPTVLTGEALLVEVVRSRQDGLRLDQLVTGPTLLLIDS